MAILVRLMPEERRLPRRRNQSLVLAYLLAYLRICKMYSQYTSIHSHPMAAHENILTLLTPHPMVPDQGVEPPHPVRHHWPVCAQRLQTAWHEAPVLVRAGPPPASPLAAYGWGGEAFRVAI
ncbi:hypothetical protein K504DRAFT_20330 [Pleomassaria siparia CBS 279.74]|uniref:Uncharacterized protein n=1 Tax=Pleomassaria siparia CBS 279.74 TaxID=1314801 RepID=A0A6G1KQQ4_9PLEO|nr:hypothetical protein K504DRAFT_20330 [Pleomassaria siparia CBS 279.74]